MHVDQVELVGGAVAGEQLRDRREGALAVHELLPRAAERRECVVEGGSASHCGWWVWGLLGLGKERGCIRC